MRASLSHVAINADDLPASLSFSEAVFGRRFAEDHPGFFRMVRPHEVHVAAVQQRRDLLPDRPTTGFGNVVGAMRYDAAAT